MKKSIHGITMRVMSSFAVALMAFSSCKTDLDEVNGRIDNLEDRVTKLEKKVDEMNGNIIGFHTLVNELTEGKLIISRVETTDDGYRIHFSDGSEPIELKNGRDGEDGGDGATPSVSVEYDSETGNYYWKVNGEYLYDSENNKIVVNGKDAPTPRLEIGATLGSGYEAGAWYITVDDGASWTRVSASADELKFELEIAGNEIIITFADGSELKVPFVEGFYFIPEKSSVLVAMGETIEINVEQNKVTNTMVTKPDGWKVEVNDTSIRVTAPEAGNSYAELTGTVSILAATQGSFMTFSNIDVSAYDPAAGFSGEILLSMSEEDALSFETLAVAGSLTEEVWEAIKKFRNITELTITEDNGAFPDNIFGREKPAEETIFASLGKISAPHITALGDHALRRLDALVSVDFPSVITVGNYALANNGSLMEVNLPAATTFGRYSIYTCAVIEEMNFPSAQTLGVSCFYYNPNLKKVTLPNVTDIDDSIFHSCESLAEVNMPSVVTAGDWIFQFCSTLETISLPELTMIGKDAFYACYELSNVSLPKLTALPQNTFESCNSLVTLTMTGVETLGDNVFKNCLELKEVNLPDAKILGDAVFTGCVSLETLALPEVVKVGKSVFGGCEILETIVLPKVEQVGTLCFQNTPALITVSMPVIKELPERAFYQSGVQYAELPELISVGRDCFSEAGLVRADFPKLEVIGQNMFLNCHSLQSSSLPLATSTGGSPFLRCYAIEEISIPLLTAVPNIMFEYCYELKRVNLESVETIGNWAFEQCYALEAIDLPNARSIGSNAFISCGSLKDVKLKSATSILTNAFKDCTGIETMLLGAQDAITFTGTPFALTDATLPPITEGIDLSLNSTGLEASNINGNQWNGYTWKNIDTF